MVDAFSRLQEMFHEVRSRAASPDLALPVPEVGFIGRPADNDLRNTFDGNDLMSQVMGIDPTTWANELHGGEAVFSWLCEP